MWDLDTETIPIYSLYLTVRDLFDKTVNKVCKNPAGYWSSTGHNLTWTQPGPVQKVVQLHRPWQQAHLNIIARPLAHCSANRITCIQLRKYRSDGDSLCIMETFYCNRLGFWFLKKQRVYIHAKRTAIPFMTWMKFTATKQAPFGFILCGQFEDSLCFFNNLQARAF